MRKAERAEIIINDSINCSLRVSIKDNLDNKIRIKGSNGEIIVNNPWLPDKKSTLDIKSGTSFHKKFINSQLNIYSNPLIFPGLPLQLYLFFFLVFLRLLMQWVS